MRAGDMLGWDELHAAWPFGDLPGPIASTCSEEVYEEDEFSGEPVLWPTLEFPVSDTYPKDALGKTCNLTISVVEVIYE